MMNLVATLTIVLLACFTKSNALNENDKLEFINGGINFANDFYSKFVSTKNEKSFIFSPFSIRSCFSMLYTGLKGDAAKELENHFHLGNSDKLILSENFKYIHTKYNESLSPIKLANSILIDSNAKLCSKYENLITKNYLTNIQQYNLQNNPKDTIDSINHWVQEKTAGKIDKIMNLNDLNTNTRLILLSAIYFKGNWKHKFNIKETKMKKFWLTSNQSIEMDMMHLNKPLRFRRVPKFKANMVELPYANSDLSMILLVPRERGGFKHIEENINEINFLELTKNLRMGSIDLLMPKFKIQTEIDLIDPLNKMGVKAIFNGGNFRDLAETDGVLFVSKATHKAIIEVNEEGTEAAAITESGLSVRTGPMRIHADRPFLFMIKDTAGNNFFMGSMKGN